MRRSTNSLELTATDLVGFLNCRYLSYLDLAVAEGSLSEPEVWDPLLQLLWERGSAHEAEYVAHLSHKPASMSPGSIRPIQAVATPIP
jgi:uncharacterized protein